MDLLTAQALIGIWVSETDRKLTPVSVDVFVSIPDKDLDNLHVVQGDTPSKSESNTW